MTTHWILTATGRDFPLSGLPTVMPDAAPRIEDIAHALAQINRYTGHAARPYSVAEHSLLVCEIVRAKGLNCHAQLRHDPTTSLPWPILDTPGEEVRALQSIDLLPPVRTSMTWRHHRDAFTQRYHELAARCSLPAVMEPAEA